MTNRLLLCFGPAHDMIMLRHTLYKKRIRCAYFTAVKIHTLFSIPSVFEVVSQQSEPLRFSVRGFGCTGFYFVGGR